MKIIRKRLNTVLAAAAAGLCYYIFVCLTGLGIPCPVRTVTRGRILCPGCGISRMCLRIARLDLVGAFHSQPVIFSLLPIWGVCIALWLFGKGDKFIRIVEIISIILMLGYCIIRNIYR